MSFHKQHYKIYQLLRSNYSKLHFQRPPLLAIHAHVLLRLACLMYLLKQLAGGGCRKGLPEKRMLLELRDCSQWKVSILCLLWHCCPCVQDKQTAEDFHHEGSKAFEKVKRRGCGKYIFRGSEDSEMPRMTSCNVDNNPTSNRRWDHLPINISMIKRCYILLLCELMTLTVGHVFPLLFSNCFQCIHHCL